MYWLIDSLVLGVRALAILAMFQAVGGYVFLYLFERELLVTAASIRSLVRWSALAALVLAMSYYFLVPVRMAGSFAGLFDDTLGAIVSSSSTAPAQIAAFAGLALIAASVDMTDRFGRALCLAGGAIAMLSFALTGHTSLHALRPLLAPVLVVHVGVAAVWLGSMWPLRIVAGREQAAVRTRIVRAFSHHALRAVPLLLACGLAMTVVLAGSADRLLTPYGAMLGLKVAGFTAVLAIANFNRTRLTPAMAAGAPAGVRTFRRVLIGEALLLGAVIVVTVFMTGLFAPENLHASFGEGHD